MSDRLVLSTKENLRTQEEAGNQILELLKTHVLLELKQDHKCKHEIIKAQNTEEVIDTLTVHDHISHRDMSLLEEIVQQFCEPLQNQVTQLETLRGLEALKHDVISELAPSVPLYLLKFCTLCTPLACGASHYYRSIAHIHDTASVIRRVYSSTDPRLFLRIVLQFSEHVPTKERVQAYSAAVKAQSSLNSAEDELLKFQEQYSSIITELIDRVDRYDNPITDMLYCQYRYHGIPLWTENRGQLPILPFFNYQCTTPLINTLIKYVKRQMHMHTYNKHQLTENIAETLTKLVSYETQWQQYSRLTKVATVSETMLNEYPIDFAQEDLVIIVVHLNGEHWKTPTLLQCVELAKPISEAFGLPLGSVTTLRPILTHNETDAKGHCKVELAAPTKATCVIIQQLDSKERFLMDQSITHVELKATGKYHFNHPTTTQALHILQKQAFQNKYLRSHFQELHSAVLPHTIQQSNERWRVLYMYVVIVFTVVLAATTYQHL